ncbi:MAG: hypothetical protein ACYDH9_18325 [Limisphaerales bacterium]
MSAVCILAPIVVAAWPAFSAAVVAAASSLGYTVAQEAARLAGESSEQTSATRVDLEIPQSELVTGQLGRDQRISVTREGVTVTFSRDARGQAALCVTGQGRTEAALRALGEELSGRVVQQYVYQKLMDDMRARKFLVVEEETDANHAIHLKVRHWEN